MTIRAEAQMYDASAGFLGLPATGNLALLTECTLLTNCVTLFNVTLFEMTLCTAFVYILCLSRTVQDTELYTNHCNTFKSFWC